MLMIVSDSSFAFTPGNTCNTPSSKYVLRYVSRFSSVFTYFLLFIFARIAVLQELTSLIIRFDRFASSTAYHHLNVHLLAN